MTARLDSAGRPPLGTLVHAGAALLVLVCTAALLLARERRDGPLAAGLRSGAETSAPAHVFVVLQPEDCDSRVTYLEVFGRRALRDRFQVSGLLLGSPEELEAVRATLARGEVRLPLRIGGPDDRRALSALGYARTPMLVVVDGGARVRMAAPLPTTRDEEIALTQMLESLAGTL